MVSLWRFASVALLVAGTIVGSLGAVHRPFPASPLFHVGWVLLVAGLVVTWRSRRAAAGGPAAASAPAQQHIARFLELAEALQRDRAGLSNTDIVQRVDQCFLEAGFPFEELQQSLLAQLGGARYAEVMGEYANAERLLYRAWSSAADGHHDEAVASLTAAVPHCRLASAAFTRA